MEENTVRRLFHSWQIDDEAANDKFLGKFLPEQIIYDGFIYLFCISSVFAHGYVKYLQFISKKNLGK